MSAIPSAMMQTPYNPYGTPTFVDPSIMTGAINQQTSRDVAQQQANAQLGVAGINAGASNYGADAQKAAQEYAAQMGYNTAMGTAGINQKTQLGVANIGAAASNYQAEQSRAAQEAVANTSANASMFDATQAANASRYGADQGLAGTKYSSDAAAKASMYGAEQQAGASKYATDQTSARYQQALNLSNQRFGQIWPFVQSQMGGLGGTSSSGSSGAAYTPTSPAPTISTGGVYSPGQIQAGRNQAMADATKNYLAMGRDIASGLATRGVGQTYDSPLTKSLMDYNAAQGIATGQANAQNFEMTAAQQNAQQNLASQQANYNAWKGQQDLQIAAQQNKYNYSAALLNALLGYAGSSIPNPS